MQGFFGQQACNGKNFVQALLQHNKILLEFFVVNFMFNMV
jgi:hypothetical protein